MANGGTTETRRAKVERRKGVASLRGSCQKLHFGLNGRTIGYVTWRMPALCVSCVMLSVSASACGLADGPTGSRLTVGPTLRSELEHVTGIPLRPAARVPIPGGASAQPFVYVGSNRVANLVVFVFDRERDTRNLTGGGRRLGGGTDVIAVGGVVVLYTPESPAAPTTERIWGAVKRAA